MVSLNLFFSACHPPLIIFKYHPLFFMNRRSRDGNLDPAASPYSSPPPTPDRQMPQVYYFNKSFIKNKRLWAEMKITLEKEEGRETIQLKVLQNYFICPQPEN